MSRSLRLSNEIRTDIVAACVAAMFGAREEKFQASKTVLADAVYANRFDLEEPEVLKLSPQWFLKSRDIHIMCDGFHYRGEILTSEMKAYREQVSCHLTMSADHAMPRDWDDELKITKDHKLWKQAQAIVKEWQAICEAKDTFSSQIRSIVYSAATLAKLNEIWPEGKKFFPPDPAKTGTALVPYDAILAVNKALNLP